ncbi:leucine--tRNA ligase [Candidatus Microgenomates bacterium]|nr:leucine--tRNA ligase [Candidatus Microgenomates bacterium]
MVENKKYDPSIIEPYWQKYWQENSTYEPDLKAAPKPFYNLMMFPYPSAEGLHVGNMYAFVGSDIYGRFQRMRGFDVFEPMGLDGFGIHSENYALKMGKHPIEMAKETEKNFYRQLRATGSAFAWKEKLETYDPDYYHWTQWIFIQMFKHGLAYRGKATVNWCPKCLTVLSDEQVVGGACERCSTMVEKKELEQWFFKITNYAERLLKNLEKINWTEKVKIAQRNWIGRSEGAEVEFPLVADIDSAANKFSIKVFTTRPDTLFGATFMVLSPEHPLLETLQKRNKKIAKDTYIILDKYIKTAKKKTEEERITEGREKTGVFTGYYCLNPVNQEKIPVWVADYVLMGYGTGAIMAVPAHDERDFEFAKKYDLPIREVIDGGDISKEAYTGNGPLINSGSWGGWKMPDQMNKVILWLEEKGIVTSKVNYKLRDWCISRQRYWSPPIPMIYCQDCASKNKGERKEMPGWYAVPETELPVELPFIEDYRPSGSGASPLAHHAEFYNVKCPGCGNSAKRETDVSDTFLDSAWYFFRFPSICSARSEQVPFDEEITKKWLPVDMYIGGAEHAVLHLLYTRFVTMAFKDWGLIGFEEPFKRFYAHGLLISHGAKISKSKGNIIVPDDYIARYGADTVRCYLMFLGPFDQGGDFRDLGISGIWRFLNRVWKMVIEKPKTDAISSDGQQVLERIKNQTIKRVTEDLKNLKYNTALAALMEYYNNLTDSRLQVGEKELRVHIKTLLLLLAPFAPHLAEELWQRLGGNASIHTQSWPSYKEQLISEDRTTLVVCVNGRVRGRLELQTTEASDQKIVERIISQDQKIQFFLNGQKINKIIFVPGKLINFVI